MMFQADSDIYMTLAILPLARPAFGWSYNYQFFKNHLF